MNNDELIDTIKGIRKEVASLCEDIKEKEQLINELGDKLSRAFHEFRMDEWGMGEFSRISERLNALENKLFLETLTEPRPAL